MGFPRSDVEIVYAVNEANMKHPGRRKWGRLQLRCEAEEVDKGGRGYRQREVERDNSWGGVAIH